MEEISAREAVDENPDDSAHKAFAHAMSAVGGINQHLAKRRRLFGLRSQPGDDVIARLEEWIKRLVEGLTRIAVQLKAAFTITVGTSLSVAMSFGPFSTP